jgi:hypothetical protein
MDLAVKDCEWRGGGSVAHLTKKTKWCSLTPPFIGKIEALVLFVYRQLVSVGRMSSLNVPLFVYG